MKRESKRERKKKIDNGHQFDTAVNLYTYINGPPLKGLGIDVLLHSFVAFENFTDESNA